MTGSDVSPNFDVPLPLMPLGVEHILKNKRLGLNADGAFTFDAIRR